MVETKKHRGKPHFSLYNMLKEGEREGGREGEGDVVWVVVGDTHSSSVLHKPRREGEVHVQCHHNGVWVL